MKIMERVCRWKGGKADENEIEQLASNPLQAAKVLMRDDVEEGYAYQLGLFTSDKRLIWALGRTLDHGPSKEEKIRLRDDCLKAIEDNLLAAVSEYRKKSGVVIYLP